jgi:hypothetical protein
MAPFTVAHLLPGAEDAGDVFAPAYDARHPLASPVLFHRQPLQDDDEVRAVVLRCVAGR